MIHGHCHNELIMYSTLKMDAFCIMDFSCAAQCTFTKPYLSPSHSFSLSLIEPSFARLYKGKSQKSVNKSNSDSSISMLRTCNFHELLTDVDAGVHTDFPFELVSSYSLSIQLSREQTSFRSWIREIPVRAIRSIGTCNHSRAGKQFTN